MAFSETLDFAEALRERQRWIGLLHAQTEKRCSPQLFLDDQRLFDEFEASSEKLVFHFEKVALAHLQFERLVDNRESRIDLNVLPT